MDVRINAIRGSFNSILEDAAIPKSLKTRIDNVVEMLNGSSEISLRLTKVLNELEEITGDNNLSPHLRTQIWNIISGLEEMLTII